MDDMGLPLACYFLILHSLLQSKWIVSVLFCSVILLKHDAEALWTVLGSVFNVTLSVTLKRVINQERPVANLRSDPGMPSSHAQSISFIVTFSIVSRKCYPFILFSASRVVILGPNMQ